jgi:protein TonB
LDSVVGGESSVAVPVGNTLMTKERKPGPPGPPQPLATPPPAGAERFSPLADIYISKHPQVLKEVKAEHPKEALRLGLEGLVVLQVGIDRTGKVRSVRVVQRAGSGFDEAAVQALWKFRFSAAVANDGKPADYVLTYRYRFVAER